MFSKSRSLGPSPPDRLSSFSQGAVRTGGTQALSRREKIVNSQVVSGSGRGLTWLDTREASWIAKQAEAVSRRLPVEASPWGRPGMQEQGSKDVQPRLFVIRVAEAGGPDGDRRTAGFAIAQQVGFVEAQHGQAPPPEGALVFSSLEHLFTAAPGTLLEALPLPAELNPQSEGPRVLASLRGTSVHN